MRCLVTGWVVGCSLIVTSGCAPRDTRVTGPADPAVLASVRTELSRADPSVIVGVVSEVLPRERFAAVSQVPVDEFRVGEVVTFIDTQQQTITHGVVRRLTPESLHVEFQDPPRGSRAPRVGDLAVRFKRIPRQPAHAPGPGSLGIATNH